jgi:rare lipoprotein A
MDNADIGAATIRSLLAAYLAALLLAGCSSAPERYAQKYDSAPLQQVDVSRIKDAVPRPEPRSRYGNPSSYVVNGKRYHTVASSAGYRERGIASWYGTKFHGHRTSSGDTYDMYQMTAAHKSLPLPTYARVTNLRNDKSVIVKINDRGPFHDNRLIDLSYAAAARLEILSEGTGLVEVEAIDPRQYNVEQKPQSQQPVAASQPKLAVAETAAAAAERNNTELYLQLGAFQQRANAERLQSELAAMEFPGSVHISEGLAGQGRVYRVRIGPLHTVESADRVSRILGDQGIEAGNVVID